MHAGDYGNCECGCGQKTKIAAKTNSAQHQIKGQPNRYLAGHRPKKHPDYLPEDHGYTTPCWIWQGGKDRLGYGLINRLEHSGVAHIWFYKRAKGPIPEGLELDHLCRVRACVNPDHFEAVTHEENILRGVSPTAINARKTHCDHGHKFTPENTYVRPSNTRTRECRICRRESVRRAEAKKRAARAERP